MAVSAEFCAHTHIWPLPARTHPPPAKPPIRLFLHITLAVITSTAARKSSSTTEAPFPDELAKSLLAKEIAL